MRHCYDLPSLPLLHLYFSLHRPIVYPWRRELHLSEQVAFLSKRDTSLDPSPHGRLSEGSTRTSAAVGAHPSSAPLAKTTSSPDAFAPEASLYSPLRPSKKNHHSTQLTFGDCNQPGLDASGNTSTRLATLPDFPFNSSGGRVAISSAIVLPAGMGIRHPASFAASKYAGQVCEYLALWCNCADPRAKKVMGEESVAFALSLLFASRSFLCSNNTRTLAAI